MFNFSSGQGLEFFESRSHFECFGSFWIVNTKLHTWTVNVRSFLHALNICFLNFNFCFLNPFWVTSWSLNWMFKHNICILTLPTDKMNLKQSNHHIFHTSNVSNHLTTAPNNPKNHLDLWLGLCLNIQLLYC